MVIGRNIFHPQLRFRSAAGHPDIRVDGDVEHPFLHDFVQLCLNLRLRLSLVLTYRCIGVTGSRSKGPALRCSASSAGKRLPSRQKPAPAEAHGTGEISGQGGLVCDTPASNAPTFSNDKNTGAGEPPLRWKQFILLDLAHISRLALWYTQS